MTLGNVIDDILNGETPCGHCKKLTHMLILDIDAHGMFCTLRHEAENKLEEGGLPNKE